MKSALIFSFIIIFNALYCNAQTVNEKLARAIEQLEKDPHFLHAIVGLSVFDSKADTAVYEHNVQLGLAPASTQKIFTSCAAFDLLGKNYRYKTTISYKYFRQNPSRSYFVIKPSGDPTFGSPRFDSTKATMILKNIITSIKQKQIVPVSPQYIISDSAYEMNTVPGGWIWEDIGN